MLKKRNGFLMVGLLAAFLFALGCAGSGGETKKDEESTPRTLPAYNYSGKKIPIVVMDFETRVPGHGYRVGQGASDMLITALFKTKKYRVYERNKLKSIMKEQKLQMSGAVDMSTAVQIGKLVGAKYIVTDLDCGNRIWRGEIRRARRRLFLCGKTVVPKHGGRSSG